MKSEVISPVAKVEVRIKNPDLARRIDDAIATALEAARAALPALRPKTIRLRTHRRLEALGPRKIEGRVAIVRVTAQNARRLPSLVEAIRAARPLGVQLVWSGVEPARETVEHHVFSVLERARATPSGAPVVLTRSSEPNEALGVLMQWKKERS